MAPPKDAGLFCGRLAGILLGYKPARLFALFSPCHQAGGEELFPGTFLAACSSLRQAMARDELIAIGAAFIAVGAYELLSLMGAVLVGGP
jgi:hypothetical protein